MPYGPSHIMMSVGIVMPFLYAKVDVGIVDTEIILKVVILILAVLIKI